MKTQWYDVEIIKKHMILDTIRVQARNKGDALGKAAKLYRDHTLSFKAFSVNKEHNV